MMVSSHAGMKATAGNKMLRMAGLLMCALVVLSLFLNFTSGIHTKTDETVRFTGIDFLLGRPEGKSNGSANPLLVITLAAVFFSVIAQLFFSEKRQLPVIMTVIALFSIFMFRFDLIYSAKNEFNLTNDSVQIGVGWMIACITGCAALLALIWNNVIFSNEKRRAQAMAIHANTALPEGYRVRSTRDIIWQDMQRHWSVYLLILPTVIFYIVWCYGPLYGIMIAFNDFSPKKGIIGSNWVGLRWFRDFFRSPFAERTIRNTLYINFLNLLIGFPAPIILALMLNEMRSMRYKRVVQTITYMPYFVSLVVLCGILVDFTSSDGLFGSIAAAFGGTPTNLLGDAKYFRTIYIGSELWQRLGWDSIIYLSALSAIDQELYEAAVIDGANRWKQTLHVTLPGIMPTIAILLVLRIGSMMNVGYEKIILLYNGLTYETADVISSFVYRKGVVEADFSFSTAVNLFNSLINFILVILANRTSALLTETSLW